MDAFAHQLARHEKTSLVALAGDWHGNLQWAELQVERVAARGCHLILHLGDFGVWPGPRGKAYLQKLDEVCERHGVDIWVTLGNHEDHGRLGTLWQNLKHQDEWGYHRPLSLGTRHIYALPRPFRFTLSGVSFLSLGGAASVDFDYRTPGRDWWPAEMLTHEQVREASEGGYADIMLTHETPDPPYAITAVQHLLATNPLGFSLEGLSYSAVSRKRLTQAVEAVRPRLLAHGHMHLPGVQRFRFEGASYDSAVLGLAHEHTATNLALLDLTSLDQTVKELR